MGTDQGCPLKQTLHVHTTWNNGILISIQLKQDCISAVQHGAAGFPLEPCACCHTLEVCREGKSGAQIYAGEAGDSSLVSQRNHEARGFDALRERIGGTLRRQPPNGAAGLRGAGGGGLAVPYPGQGNLCVRAPGGQSGDCPDSGPHYDLYLRLHLPPYCPGSGGRSAQQGLPAPPVQHGQRQGAGARGAGDDAGPAVKRADYRTYQKRRG
ncbi:hypothetical protein D3C75_870290 [compost metagenome]